MASTDDDFTRAQRGVTAAQLREQLEHRVHEKANAILQRAITDFRGGTLTGDHARACIASIAELRSLLGDLDRDVRQGQEARERLMSPSPHGTARS